MEDQQARHQVVRGQAGEDRPGRRTGVVDGGEDAFEPGAVEPHQQPDQLFRPGLDGRAGGGELARDLRQRFQAADLFVVNLVSSPGAGKTTFLQATLAALRSRCRVAALVGDLAT